MHLTLITLLAIMRVAFVGDPQIDNMKELSYARKSIFAELMERKDLDLVVVMGDLVNNKPEMLPTCFSILDSLNCPWVMVEGNHEKRNPIPEDSSFIKGGIRFVMLNHEDSPIPEAIDGEKTVYCSHYPFTAVPDSSSNSLYVSAHLHIVFREMKGNAEHIGVGATCGTWWRGEKDSQGIPYALMNCGAPRGYFVAEFNPDRKKWYSLRFKAVGREDDLQADARLSVPEDGKARILVNLYGGAENGVLEVRKGIRWVKAEKVKEIDPKVQDIIEYNKTIDRAWRKAHRDLFLPMLHRDSPHLWAVDAEGLDGKEEIRIRYSDRSMRIKPIRVKLTR